MCEEFGLEDLQCEESAGKAFPMDVPNWHSMVLTDGLGSFQHVFGYRPNHTFATLKHDLSY